MALQDKAMLVNLNIRAWSARKRDKKVGKEVETNHQATNAGNFNKLLIDSDALRPIVSLTSSLRDLHYKKTLPWGDNGDRLLPGKMFFEYTKDMRDLRGKFDQAVRDFCAGYPAYVQAARKRLGTMYDPSDYSDVKDIERKFSAKPSFLPIPHAQDFRVDIGAEEVDAIKAEITKTVAALYTGATRDLWKRLYVVVEAYMDRLADDTTVFRDSLVENAIFACGIASKLNIDDDEALDDLAKDIEDRLTKIAPQRLRDDKALRKQVYNSAKDILKKMPKWAASENQ